MELKQFLLKELLLLLMDQLIYDPKNRPDGIILEICALEIFKSVDRLLLDAFF